MDSRNWIALDHRFELAEGPVWDFRVGRARWVDINQGAVHSARIDGHRLVDLESIRLNETVGAVGLARDGGLVVAGRDRIITISPRGTPRTWLELGIRTGSRLNDASVDPFGQLVAGTLSLDESSYEERLLRVRSDGSIETLRDHVGLSNGIGWSPDGRTIYHVDSIAKTVSAHAYGPDEFDTNQAWRTLPLTFDGSPDGMTVDADGKLWVAQWGGSSVVRFDPQSGKEADRVRVGASQVSCVTFVGEDLSRLLLTTATQGLDRTANDEDGAIYIADVNVRGLPENLWAGSTI